MKTLICGTGVRGTLVGAALIENGAEVTFACRPTRQRQLIGRGLEITSPLGRFRKPVHAPPVTQITGPFEVVVVATRANVYSMTLFHFRKLLTPDTLVVHLFDGVYQLDRSREDYYAGNPVALSVFEARATQDADGAVRQTLPAGRLHLGMVTSHGGDRLDTFAKLLEGRRFATAVDDAMLVRALWARHIFVASGVAAAQIGGQPLRDVIRFGSRTLFGRLLDEGIAIGEAHRVERIAAAVRPYQTAIFREGVPVSAPTPIAEGGAAGSENLFLMGNMLRQALDKKVPAPLLRKAWESTAKHSVKSSSTEAANDCPTDAS